VNAAMPDQRAPLMCNAPRNGPGGLGANKPPRWSAERRASPGAQTVKASLRGDARTYVTGPLYNGCRCTRAPVGAPLPSFCKREILANLGGLTPRENDDVCSCRSWDGSSTLLSKTSAAHALLKRCIKENSAYLTKLINKTVWETPRNACEGLR
jgi:hypothetical protein